MPWWVVAAIIVVVAIALAAWWWVPKWQANRLSPWNDDRLALATIEDNWRKTITQLIAGAAVLIGAGLAKIFRRRRLGVRLHGAVDYALGKRRIEAPRRPLSDAGGFEALSEIKLGLIKRAAALTVECEKSESRLADGVQRGPPMRVFDAGGR